MQTRAAVDLLFAEKYLIDDNIDETADGYNTLYSTFYDDNIDETADG